MATARFQIGRRRVVAAPVTPVTRVALSVAEGDDTGQNFARKGKDEVRTVVGTFI